MGDAVYFVVLSRAGAESAALYYDRLPVWMTGKHATARGLIYALRLDILPRAERWLAMSATDLHRIYLGHKAGTTLPPSNIAPPPQKKAESGRKFGERWTPPPPTWDPKAPAASYLRVVEPKHDAPARTAPAVEISAGDISGTE